MRVGDVIPSPNGRERHRCVAFVHGVAIMRDLETAEWSCRYDRWNWGGPVPSRERAEKAAAWHAKLLRELDVRPSTQ